VSGNHGGSDLEGESTRARILGVARARFAADGYQATSVRAITGAAGVNLGAVTYHFGSKEALYHQVLQAVLLPLRDRVVEVCARPVPSRVRVQEVIHAVFEHLAANPDQPNFILQIRQAGGPPPPVVMEIMRPVIGALTRMVEEGQEEGTIREGPPVLFVLSLLAQPIYLTLALGAGPAHQLPVRGETREHRALLIDHMVEFALGGLAPREGTS